MTTLTCRLCNQGWDRPKKRGRVPTICPTCKEKLYGIEPNTSETLRQPLMGKERVDRLEMMLRANNVHIQQHTKDDE